MEKLIRQNLKLDNTAKTRKAEPHELDRLLGRKLVEESSELLQVLMFHTTVINEQDRRARLVEESADILEVLNTILWRHGISNFQVANHLELKHNTKGGFTDLVLTNASDERREDKLATLVEDCMSVLLTVATGKWAWTNGARESIAALHRRAEELGALGTAA